MNKLTVLFGVLLCLAVVNARHYGDRSESERNDDEEHQGLRRDVDHTSHTKHRRRRWQMNGGYDYQPSRYDYRNDRRDYYGNQQDLIPQIFKLLEEISAYIRRTPPPPPPPQPIYIPYPVPYPIPKVVICKTPVKPSPNVTSRFPAMEDTNQNWGFVTSEENTNDDYDENDGARPISFEPIKPKKQMKRPAPSVEHGSGQSINPITTQAPFLPEGRTPNMCNAAVLSCCGITDQASQKQCFINIGCPSQVEGKMCTSEAIAEALESFKRTYAPVN